MLALCFWYAMGSYTSTLPAMKTTRPQTMYTEGVGKTMSWAVAHMALVTGPFIKIQDCKDDKLVMDPILCEYCVD